MKKLLLFFALCFVAVSGRAAFIVNNTTGCDVKFQVGVDKAGGCSSYNASTPIVLGPGNSVAYNDPTFVPSWVATPTPIASDVFTWLRVFPSITATCTTTPGNQVSDSPCGPFTTGPVAMTLYDASCTSCSSVNIEWTIVGPDIIVNIY